MARPEDNVVPFRRKPRKWTQPEDFLPGPGKSPKPPKRPKGNWSKPAAWALIAAVVALTVVYSVWG